ncbi:MAG: hypothetical protein HKN91_11740 [Acidimicrobiia bacterium]|nr:hypothetical protein [Acidimicrobiia bacterium]
MDDFPAKIADFLETIANRVRQLTVERVAGWARWTAIGVVLAILGLLMAIFTIVALFRLISELITVEGAYALFGSIFVIVGIVLWSKRLPKAEEQELAEPREL